MKHTGPGQPGLPTRKPLRLPSYDYASEGLYFLTLVTHDRQRMFGSVTETGVTLNRFGEIAETEWLRSSEIRQEIELGPVVFMPNHVHGIVVVLDHMHGVDGIAPDREFRPPSGVIGSLVRGYKGAVTARINAERGTPGAAVWQRNYFERVIRSEREYSSISKYIADNPRAWWRKYGRVQATHLCNSRG